MFIYYDGYNMHIFSVMKILYLAQPFALY